jgi:hypothetical protein
MKGSIAAACASVIVALAGCATDDKTTVVHEAHYRTGSNIPMRDHAMPNGVSTATVNSGDPSVGMPHGLPLPSATGGR